MTLGRVAATVGLVLVSNSALAASFDCLKASPGLEKQICTDAELSRADEEMADYFFKLKDSLDGERAKHLLNEQREWLRQRKTLCTAGDLSCLKRLYNDRIHALRIKYENLVPFTFANSASFQGLRGTCGFPDVKFPQEFSIYATGWYSGRELEIQIDQSGHKASQFDVVVNSPQKPVVLILGAYEPSVWNVGWTKETKILAVVATGYHRQAVVGLPNETPILISTHDNRGPCRFTYLNGQNGTEVDGFARSVLGRSTDAIVLAGGGRAVLGSPLKSGEQLFTSADITINDLIDKGAPLAGPAGLADGVKRGFLRLATKEDREAWMKRKMGDAQVGSTAVGSDSFRKGVQPLVTDQSYVILKPFRLPKGLTGGNLAVFFLPKGVPFPEGDLGHSVLYDFNTMTCHGHICNVPEQSAR